MNVYQTVKRYFQFKPKDILLVPMMDSYSYTTGVMMLCNSNSDINPSNLKENEKFKAVLCTNIIKILIDKVDNCNSIELLKAKRLEMSETYSTMLNHTETWRLFNYIEGPLCDFFKVHRINFLLCNHTKNELYKIVKHGKTAKQQIVSYDEFKGLAKAVATDGVPIMTNNALHSKKFFASVDDPKMNYAENNNMNTPVSILSVPVYL